MEKEIRQIIIESIETRATEDNAMIIEGYITKFNTKSQFMEWFFEQVSPQAFDKTLSDGHNIYALYNHDSDKLLGSTKTGTLELNTDNIGLRFKLTLNSNVSYARDVYELVKAREVEGCSFGFICNNDEWVTQSDGTDLRTLLDVELIEVTITPYPAYLDSEANTRSYKNHKQELEAKEQKELKLKLLALELEL